MRVRGVWEGEVLQRTIRRGVQDERPARAALETSPEMKQEIRNAGDIAAAFAGSRFETNA